MTKKVLIFDYRQWRNTKQKFLFKFELLIVCVIWKDYLNLDFHIN